MHFITKAALTGLIASSSVLLTSGDADAQIGLVISEVYPGGGTGTGSPAFKRDFIELFNGTGTTLNLDGYSLQYASATGAFSNIFALPAATLFPGSYFLVNTGTAGAAGADNPAGDASGTLNLGATAGKVALVNGTASIGTITGDANTATPAAGSIVDFVGYGATATAREGSGDVANNAPPPGSTANSIARNASNADTNINSADFINGVPTPFAAVPEPSSVLFGLMGAGMGGVQFLRVRRRSGNKAAIAA